MGKIIQLILGLDGLVRETMAHSIYGHISYILKANSERSNNFSLIGRKPNEILQFK